MADAASPRLAVLDGREPGVGRDVVCDLGPGRPPVLALAWSSGARALVLADAKGMLEGQVVIVPMANPIGLSQRIEHVHVGRFDLDGGGNFNRHYPALAEPVAELVKGKLTDSAEGNVVRIRAAMAVIARVGSSKLGNPAVS